MLMNQHLLAIVTAFLASVCFNNRMLSVLRQKNKRAQAVNSGPGQVNILHRCRRLTLISVA